MRERRRVGAACRWARWVDSSDAWVQLKANKRMTYEYTPAENGQVAPMAGLDTQELAWDLTLLAIGIERLRVLPSGALPWNVFMNRCCLRISSP